jgi:hypothetical protein
MIVELLRRRRRVIVWLVALTVFCSSGICEGGSLDMISAMGRLVLLC